jgi:uncharacterized surface protein with fasciclin (FAS1) repeats
MSRSSRRSVLKGIGVGTAALVGGAGVVSASPGRGPPSKGDTIVDVAVAEDGFDVLVAAVEKAGLVDALSGNRQLTVFAPTDEAFNSLGISVDEDGNLDVEDPAASLLADSSLTLGDVLTYHVTPGRRKEKSVITSKKVPTLNGARIDVDGIELNDGQADIVATNIEASNGIVHVIDGVLLP